MNRIDTEISSITVEIEEKEYPVAEKTVAIAEQLLGARRHLDGEPEYKLWLEELSIMLGKPAVRELFSSGKSENIDRLQRIHSSVLRAFNHNSDELREQETDRQREQLAFINDFLRQLVSIMKTDGNGSKPVIRRP